MTATATKWDVQSGIRERLALLAQFGPDLDPHVWGYHSHRDHWYYCGPPRDVAGRGVRINHEGAKSLELIAERWNMDRATAMSFIGYPDAH
jgi:hypothetical protein